MSALKARIKREVTSKESSGKAARAKRGIRKRKRSGAGRRRGALAGKEDLRDDEV
ncbi:hypothetical protein GCWU000341_01083 [Oribacterium sp. oral taxon 078 str. F0262]|nr:hypothetical protein GCWU000341_01083 [Oribacterium sp. oral taxon 078 str. F0262]